MCRVLIDFSFCCSQPQFSSLAATQTTTVVMSHDDDLPAQEDGRSNDSEGDEADTEMEAILNDPVRKAALLRKIGLEDSGSGKQTGQTGHTTPGGKSMGGWSSFPPAPCWPPFPYPGFPPFSN